MVRRGGFMLIELVIALALLALLVNVIWGTLSQLTQAHKEVRLHLDRTQQVVLQHEGGVEPERRL